MIQIFGTYYQKYNKHISRCAKKHRILLSENMNIKDLISSYPLFILESYLPLVDYTVQKYAYDLQDHDDLKQEIYLYLIEKKIKYIATNYNDNFDFTPYLLKIIINTCFEIQRKKATHEVIEYNEIYASSESDSPEDEFEKEKLFIEKSLIKFRNSKVLLAFKVFNMIKIMKTDIKEAYRTMSSWDLNKAATILSEPSKSNIPFFIELTNKYDRTTRKKDSFRRIIQRYLHEVIIYINSHDRNYDIKSITQMLIIIFNDQIDLLLEKDAV